ncbi:MAG: hypothetical protein LBS90_07980, partial [Oscillospiraceae bacterium]|nr:hypothetical protein [Oscillospiraceae bacterium]
FGGPYYLKAECHWSELDNLYGGALDTYEVAYSYYSGSRMATDSARGFYLSDFLQYAGVDLNSVATLDFYTKDHTAGAYRSFTKYSMLDAPRYYFPNMFVDEGTKTLTAIDGGSLWDGALQVETMMALEDSWEWDAVGANFANYGTSSRFRLLFGQLSPTEAMTSSSAKYVHSVYVTFSGTPALTSDEPNLSATVGSDYRVTVNVAAEDSLLDEYVKANLVWSSNNTDAVEVDMYGNLKVKAEGEAVITAAFGDSVVSVVVSAGGVSAAPDIVVPPAPQSPADANPGGAAQPAPPAVPDKPNANQSGSGVSRPGADEVSYSENASGVYILSPEMMSRTEFAEWVNSVLNHGVTTDSDTGGVVNRREAEMADGAEALRVKINAVSSAPMYIAAGGMFAAGLIGSVVSFRLQTGGTDNRKVRKPQ